VDRRDGLRSGGPGNDAVNQKFTAKERDSESGLDYFGARYYGSALGRLTSADPKEFTSRTIENPQKWNKYAYVINNPLLRIDPDGDDDFIVFRPLAKANGASWNAIKAEAAKHGNTVTIYNGSDATAARYTSALQGGDDTHVIFSGHTVEYASDTGLQAGSVLLTGNVGVGIATPQNGTSVPVPSQVTADSVAIFGFNSTGLASQYAPSDFTRSRPTTNTTAEDAGAASYTNSLVRNQPLGQATNAAENSMVNVTNQVNKLPENRGQPYSKPQVCTTVDGKTTCR
jgi:RHS repeat-associated protein